MGFKAILSEFKSLLCHLLADNPWTRDFTLYSEDFTSISENYDSNPYPKRLLWGLKELICLAPAA